MSLPDIDIKHASGGGSHKPSRMMILKIDDGFVTMRHDITRQDCSIPQHFIDRWESLLEEMKEQNELVRQQKREANEHE